MKSSLKELDVSIYVIADSRIRTSRILEQLKNESIDYHQILPNFLDEFPVEFNQRRSRVLSKKNLTLSEIGCAKSHLNAYKVFLDSDEEYAIVFEDDAHLIDSNFTEFFSVVDKFISFGDLDFARPRVLLLYTESANVCDDHKDFFSIVGNASHAMAYIVNRKAAQELYFRNLQFDYVADWPRGTKIQFHLAKTKLFEHGSKNGSVKSLIETDRKINLTSRKTKFWQNFCIILFFTYFRNLNFFSGLKDYLRTLWIPIIQWQYFRLTNKPLLNSNSQIYVRIGRS